MKKYHSSGTNKPGITVLEEFLLWWDGSEFHWS